MSLNKKVKLVTVATHTEGYLPWLKLSCERHNTDLTILGFGEKWQGYAWKLNLMLNYIKTLEENILVCFIDAYDVLLLRPLDEIVEYYNKIVSLTNKKIIIADDVSVSNITKFFSYVIFGKCKNTIINSGTYIGMRDDIIDVLNFLTLRFKPSDNDQIILSDYIKANPNDFYIDCDNLLFLTINHPGKDILDVKDIIISDNNLSYMGNKPFFIHGNGNTKMENMIRKLNYEIDSIMMTKVNNNSITTLCSKALYYIKIILNKIYFEIILIVCLIMYYNI